MTDKEFARRVTVALDAPQPSDPKGSLRYAVFLGKKCFGSIGLGQRQAVALLNGHPPKTFAARTDDDALDKAGAWACKTLVPA